ncbi:MAG: serine hydroxymethyltransferase [Anaerolineae bacterium]|jgi:glycine hydroxymethyltransferase|nr:serine hydroxymethyltransferase [Anaerolineae bacterium]
MVTSDQIKDYLFRGNLDEIDPDVAELVRHETARQARYLIMIPSESTIPQAVRETLSSAFHNIYAEGYPLESTRVLPEAELLDYNARLTEYRRYGDERYYMGTEYANIVESLARRRAAELFATDRVKADDLFVNVQALSGAPANNAVYSALLKVGDVVMGMDLIQGGHLTHGSPVNRSGKNYTIVSYGINPSTGQIDYDEMLRLAKEHQPKMIIGGYSSYPHTPDWAKYREIADAVGAYLLADIAHVAGLVAAGVYPNPVGIADVVTFTTHKTLGGPRGAVIITHKKALATKLDRAVFPGEQGGPHMNAIAALAVALKLAATDQFKELQQRTVENAARLAQRLHDRGLRIPFNGTTTHLLNVDCSAITGPDGTPLSGDMAARILDLVGIVCNRQTIPGDTSALRPSGIRLGTPWITQRGFGPAEIDELADIIADVLLNCVPFSYSGKKNPLARAKLDFELLQNAKLRVRDLAASVGIDTDAVADDYPHFYYSDSVDGAQTLSISGPKSKEFLQVVLTSDVEALKVGEQQATRLLTPHGQEVSYGLLENVNDQSYLLHVNDHGGYIAAWLRALSDGFVIFDHQDIYAKVPGPVDVRVISPTRQVTEFAREAGYAPYKTYFIGMNGEQYLSQRDFVPQPFVWQEPQRDLLTTSLHSLHKNMNAKMVEFAGYDMPVWYTSVMEEHLAVRNSAGIFDVTHMGVFDVRGAGAEAFLNAVTTNDVPALAVGESHYTYFLDTDGIPLDDLMIYRLALDHFMVVVNASNNDKNWAWLKAVKNGEVIIDPAYLSRRAAGADRCVLRDLRNRTAGKEMRVDLALQGPQSLNILLKLEASEEVKARLKALAWAGVMPINLGGYDLIISRTGYTGERVAYELFVHPEAAPYLFRKLIDLGATACGLASRDSLRTEAGLPLYGHELAGSLNLNPADAGFDTYVKLSKPFFVGKTAYIAHEQQRDAEIARFRLEVKGARPAHQGDPMVDRRGRVVGIVTSCSIDSEGYQLGQVYLKQEYHEEGTQLFVFAGSERTKPQSVAGLSIGSKAPMPESATILSRFPKRKK